MKCIMEWNGNKVTDHGRAAVSVDTERIGTDARMANGMLRRYVVAYKRTFSTSWDDVPHSASFTVDGFWGGREMQNFFRNTTGQFNLKLNYADGTSETIVVAFDSFDSSIKKRGTYEFWDVSVSLVEV
jgi:hypothetical protein